MGKDKKKGMSPSRILVSCLAIVAVMFGINHIVGTMGGDQLPAEANGGHNVRTSAERNAEYAREEAEAGEEEIDINLQEAPSEGLSRRVYEDLEQPAPIANKREMLLYKTQYIISYNIDTRCANYVCWSLDRARVDGKEKRTDEFLPDPALTEDNQVVTSDYSGSGYDRGHMCPAADNKNSRQAVMESFFMTNVCPQAHQLNTGDWNELEQLCRNWAKNYGTVYVCCGPIFDRKTPRTIGKRPGVRIAVPDRFFKVVLTMGRVPKAIGFIFPNDDTNKDIRDYAVAVDEVERITGYDFFFQLDDDEEKGLESACRPSEWGI